MKMHDTQPSIEEEYLNIAIQTVLYRYRNKLHTLTDSNDDNRDAMFRTIAKEIAYQATAMKKLTDDAIKEMSRS